MSEYTLTDKANFVESDEQALNNIVVSVGVLYTMLENLVRNINDNDDTVMNLWDIGSGLQSAAEMYTSQRLIGNRDA